MQDIVIPIGEFMVKTFGILEDLRNLPNMLFIGCGFMGLIYWLRMQQSYNKEAADNPGQIK
jgi:hypothetical protein